MRKDEDAQVTEQQLMEEIQRLTERRDFLFAHVHGGSSWIDSAKVWAVFLLIGIGLLGVFAVLREGLTTLSAVALCIGGGTTWLVLKRERQAKLDREALDHTMAELELRSEELHRMQAKSRILSLMSRS